MTTTELIDHMRKEAQYWVGQGDINGFAKLAVENIILEMKKRQPSGVVDKQRIVDELYRHKQILFDSTLPLSGTMMTMFGALARRVEAGDFDALASPSMEKGDGWMPIETAPKTGIIWLACDFSMRLGYWMEGKQHECHGSVGGGWKDFAISESVGAPMDLRFTPTRWQPTPTLTPAPAGEEQS